MKPVEILNFLRALLSRKLAIRASIQLEKTRIDCSARRKVNFKSQLIAIHLIIPGCNLKWKALTPEGERVYFVYLAVTHFSSRWFIASFRFSPRRNENASSFFLFFPLCILIFERWILKRMGIRMENPIREEENRRSGGADCIIVLLSNVWIFLAISVTSRLESLGMRGN